MRHRREAVRDSESGVVGVSGPVSRTLLDVVKSREGRLYIAAEGVGGLLRGIAEEYTALAGPGGSVRVPAGGAQVQLDCAPCPPSLRC